SWLQDVDMLACTRKRYSYADPVLRLWVRIHGHPEPPHEELIAREVQAYACERLVGATAAADVAAATLQVAPLPAPVQTAPASPPAPPEPTPQAQQPHQQQAAMAAAGAGALTAGAGGRGSGIIEID